MNNVKHYPIPLIFILLMSLCMQPLLAEEQSNEEQSNNDNTYLHVARNQLSIAFDKYNDGDITASKQSLRRASDWLNKAVTHSKSDKVKIEAQKLASEIDSFRLTLNHSSEQNDIARFWHQATSLIKRETELLIHSYITSLNDNITLRHLLDAKMHFYTADHDLFVSHDLGDAKQELNDSLKYLNQAVAIARPELKTGINNLTNNLKTLISLTESSNEPWKNDTLVDSLEKAINNITNAESSATPPTKLRLKSIEQNIHQLKLDVQKTNIKTRYDLIMADLTQAINNI